MNSFQKLLEYICLLIILQLSAVLSVCNNCNSNTCTDCNSNNNGLLEQIQKLQSRMDKWDTNYANCQNLYNSIESQLSSQCQKEQSDYNSVRTSWNDCQSNYKLMLDRMSSMNGNVDKAYLRIGDFENSHSDVKGRVVKLERASQMIKTNMGAVTKTITEIKKTIKTTHKHTG